MNDSPVPVGPVFHVVLERGNGGAVPGVVPTDEVPLEGCGTAVPVQCGCMVDVELERGYGAADAEADRGVVNPLDGTPGAVPVPVPEIHDGVVEFESGKGGVVPETGWADDGRPVPAGIVVGALRVRPDGPVAVVEFCSGKGGVLPDMDGKLENGELGPEALGFPVPVGHGVMLEFE